MTEATASDAPRGIDVARLAPWLAANVEGAKPPFRYRLIAGGHSNLTYSVEDATGSRWVLRRPPLGFQPGAGAHDMAREHRIQAALAGSAVPVASMAAVCDDASINDAPFYVMRFVDGVVVDTPQQVTESLPDAASRRQAAESLVDALVALQAIDVDAVGLGTLGRRENYIARQLNRLRQVWDKTKTRELPLIEAVHAGLAARIPADAKPGLVHGDFRLGNVMLDRASHRVAAVLDWELATLGDPRADVAYLLCSWEEPGDPEPGVWLAAAPTRAGNFPKKDALIARYAAKTGTDASSLDYFRALAYWRIAVIAEGIKRRYMSGAMGREADLDFIEARIRDRAAMAERFLAKV